MSSLATMLTMTAVFLISGTWFIVLFWFMFHIDKLTPNYLFKRRRPHVPEAKEQNDSSGNGVAVFSLIVAMLSLVSSTIIGIAQLLHH